MNLEFDIDFPVEFNDINTEGADVTLSINVLSEDTDTDLYCDVGCDVYVDYNEEYDKYEHVFEVEPRIDSVEVYDITYFNGDEEISLAEMADITGSNSAELERSIKQYCTKYVNSEQFYNKLVDEVPVGEDDSFFTTPEEDWADDEVDRRLGK